jgi:hypothetical protein
MAKILFGFLLTWVVLDRSAALLGSFREEAGIIVFLVVLAVATCVEVFLYMATGDTPFPGSGRDQAGRGSGRCNGNNGNRLDRPVGPCSMGDVPAPTPNRGEGRGSACAIRGSAQHGLIRDEPTRMSSKYFRAG